MAIYIADTYAWIAYFQGEADYKSLIDENTIKTPCTVFSEVCRVLSRRKISPRERSEFLKFMSDKSLIVPLDKVLAVRAGELSETEGLYLLDAMAYACASEDEPLLSGDNHFKGKRNVLFVK